MLDWLRRIRFRLGALFRRRRLESEMAEELLYHTNELTRANIAAGMEPEEARFAAQRAFGGVAQIEEECRDERGFAWIDQVRGDFRFILRSLSHSRGFTSVVLLTLVLGIGVTTIIFDLTAWLLVYGSPYPKSEQLFGIGFANKNGSGHYFFHSNVEFQAYQEQLSAFTQYAIVSPSPGTVAIDGEPVPAVLLAASRDCFATLGINPVLGRAFRPEEHRPGADNVVVISDFFWRQHLNASPDALGRAIKINGQFCTVIGVFAEDQRFPPNFEADLYRPFVPHSDPADEPLDTGVFVVGRLRPGVSREQALADLSRVKLPRMVQWAEDYLAQHKPYIAQIDEMQGPQDYWVMLIAAVLLYAIACLNAMNLMLIRLSGRRRELSIRFALGGSRWQVVRLVALECLVLAGLSSLVVIAAAKWAFPHLFVLLNKNAASVYTNYWDWGTLACVAGLSLVASLVIALAPLYRLSRAEITAGLKDGGPMLGESRSTARTRFLLIVMQTAFAVILLVGAGLMVRSFEELARLDLGFDPVGKVKVQVSLPKDYVLKPEERIQLFERLQQRLATLPGVRAVSYSQDALFTGYFGAGAQLLMPDGSYVPVAGSYVTADFIKTAGLQLKKGRWLTTKKWDGEAVINESFARARFGDRDPVGLTFKLKISGDNRIPVVGVVRDVRETARAAAGLRFYVPYWMWAPNINTLVLRMDRDPAKEFLGLIRPAIYGVDPKVIVENARSIDEVVLDSMSKELFALTVLKGLSAIALGLAVVGIFSVISYTAERRMPEFGLRIALGASASDVRKLVIARGLGATVLGLLAGAAAAAVLTRFIESLLFQTKPYDLAVYSSVALLLISAAGAACWYPAHRASRVDVAKLLRSD